MTDGGRGHPGDRGHSAGPDDGPGPLGSEPPPGWSATPGRPPRPSAGEPAPAAADGGRQTSRRDTEARIRDEIRRRQGGPGRSRRRGPPGDRGMWRGGRWQGGWGPRGERPDWWPQDEAWPPPHRRPWRGFGCLFGFLFIAGVLGLLSIGTTIVGHVLAAPGPGGTVIRVAAVLLVIAILAGLTRTARTIRGSGTVLDSLVDQAARVEAGDYTARVDALEPVPGPVRQLARGFNTMAARLEADEAQRRSLLADVTHELRTPLAVIRGSVEAILDGIHPADDAHLAAILEETRVLDRLIEDLRTLALSESGALSLHREPTDLAILVGEVATAFGAATAAAGTELTVAVDDDVPLLDIDPVRMREVIGNLVSNALRHAPGGGSIQIRALRRPASPTGGASAAIGDAAADRVEITVRDSGPGIPPDLLPHVFDRFARGAGSTGSGLGLAIARGLVELHGGTIRAASPPGGGAEIAIDLPIGAGG